MGYQLPADPHQFHIPVMGTGFTIDTPVKVARFGINSVVSLGDDDMIERVRAHYCREMGFPMRRSSREAPITAPAAFRLT